MEVGEVGIDLQNPVWLYKYDGPNIEERHSAREERFVLDPRDDVVQGPGDVKEDGTEGQPPLVDRILEEYKEAVPDTEDQLRWRSDQWSRMQR